ncbi:hypothetical protein WPG_2537 [Winogradskyella sp. PG-2]|nr:hypothetical protein WPG_2537 [Winogradskyella sp. PG-2]
MQNGSNENLELFNAINNPNLACILVDNPVAVISNTDGIYDNWFKDDSSSYKTFCSDADNDGIPNEDDLCPTTEFGAAVDLFGCAIPNLPNDNFAISITGETCLNSNNVKITIVAQELYTYDVLLEREDFYEEYNFTNDIDIFNLLAGTYQMCVTIEEWPNYESCYTIVITQPDPLEIFTCRVINTNDFSLNMSGSNSYNIKFNGDAFTTHSSAITLQLEEGVNRVEVSTDLECQGVYKDLIILTDDFLVYPNPFRDEIKINNGKEGGEVIVNIYSTIGQLVLNKTYINQGIEIRVDTSSLPTGMYLISIQTEAIVSTYKIVKK